MANKAMRAARIIQLFCIVCTTLLLLQMHVANAGRLNHQQIRFPLQLHTQHFQVSYPHRWSTMEKGLAIEYTLRQVKNTPLNKDYAFAWMTKLLKAAKSAITKAKSGAKRPPKPYLGAVLLLTRLVYGALDALANLPPVWRVPVGALVESKTVPKAPLPKRVRRSKAQQQPVEKPLTTRSRAKDSPEVDTNSSGTEPSLPAQDESGKEAVKDSGVTPQGVMEQCHPDPFFGESCCGERGDSCHAGSCCGPYYVCDGWLSGFCQG